MSTDMIYCISGASGKLGRLCAQALLNQIPAEQVVLTTRTPARLGESIARGPEIRFADFDEPDSLPNAFSGVDRLLLISGTSATAKRTDQHQQAIAAAVAAGVEHAVFTSMPNVDNPAHPVGLTAREYRDAERMVEASFESWVILRNAPYAELHVLERLPDLFGAGRVVTNAGDGRVPFVSREDCAAAAIAALIDERHAGRIYDVSGPETVNWREVSELVSKVSGHAVGFESLDDQAYAERLRVGGGAPLFVEAVVGLGIAIREGWFDVCTDAVERLTGSRARSLRSVLEAHDRELAMLTGGLPDVRSR